MELIERMTINVLSFWKHMQCTLLSWPNSLHLFLNVSQRPSAIPRISDSEEKPKDLAHDRDPRSAKKEKKDSSSFLLCNKYSQFVMLHAESVYSERRAVTACNSDNDWKEKRSKSKKKREDKIRRQKCRRNEERKDDAKRPKRREPQCQLFDQLEDFGRQKFWEQAQADRLIWELWQLDLRSLSGTCGLLRSLFVMAKDPKLSAVGKTRTQTHGQTSIWGVQLGTLS